MTASTSKTRPAPTVRYTTLRGTTPDDPLSFMERVPHGYHDVSLIREELADAGFTTVSVDKVTERSVAASAREAAIGFCQGTPIRAEILARDADALEAATDRVAASIADRFGDGEVVGKSQAYVMVAS